MAPDPFRAGAAALLLSSLTPAQVTCPDLGSRLVDGFWEDGPPLGCRHAPAAPAWRLWTPPHRELAPRPGYRPGNAWEIPRILVRYRCTGSWLLPTLVRDVSPSGYVIDVDQESCRAADATGAGVGRPT